MTINEAKYAHTTNATVIYNGFEWKVSAIISQTITRWQRKGWCNSLRLVPVNGSRSTTEGLMRECHLKEPMPESEEELKYD